jgi:hypothetical protein
MLHVNNINVLKGFNDVYDERNFKKKIKLLNIIREIILSLNNISN